MRAPNFTNRSELSDERSLFANDLCEFIWNASSGNLNVALESVKKFEHHFEANLKNFYEIVDREVPLVALSQLKELGPENWDLAKEQYEDAIKRAELACKEYYSKCKEPELIYKDDEVGYTVYEVRGDEPISCESCGKTEYKIRYEERDLEGTEAGVVWCPNCAMANGFIDEWPEEM